MNQLKKVDVFQENSNSNTIFSHYDNELNSLNEKSYVNNNNNSNLIPFKKYSNNDLYILPFTKENENEFLKMNNIYSKRGREFENTNNEYMINYLNAYINKNIKNKGGDNTSSNIIGITNKSNNETNYNLITNHLKDSKAMVETKNSIYKIDSNGNQKNDNFNSCINEFMHKNILHNNKNFSNNTLNDVISEENIINNIQRVNYINNYDNLNNTKNVNNIKNDMNEMKNINISKGISNKFNSNLISKYNNNLNLKINDNILNEDNTNKVYNNDSLHESAFDNDINEKQILNDSLNDNKISFKVHSNKLKEKNDSTKISYSQFVNLSCTPRVNNIESILNFNHVNSNHSDKKNFVIKQSNISSGISQEEILRAQEKENYKNFLNVINKRMENIIKDKNVIEIENHYKPSFQSKNIKMYDNINNIDNNNNKLINMYNYNSYLKNMKLNVNENKNTNMFINNQNVFNELNESYKNSYLKKIQFKLPVETIIDKNTFIHDSLKSSECYSPTFPYSNNAEINNDVSNSSKNIDFSNKFVVSDSRSYNNNNNNNNNSINIDKMNNINNINNLNSLDNVSNVNNTNIIEDKIADEHTVSNNLNNSHHMIIKKKKISNNLNECEDKDFCFEKETNNNVFNKNKLYLNQIINCNENNEFYLSENINKATMNDENIFLHSGNNIQLSDASYKYEKEQNIKDGNMEENNSHFYNESYTNLKNNNINKNEKNYNEGEINNLRNLDNLISLNHNTNSMENQMSLNNGSNNNLNNINTNYNTNMNNSYNVNNNFLHISNNFINKDCNNDFLNTHNNVINANNNFINTNNNMISNFNKINDNSINRIDNNNINYKHIINIENEKKINEKNQTDTLNSNMNNLSLDVNFKNISYEKINNQNGETVFYKNISYINDKVNNNNMDNNDINISNTNNNSSSIANKNINNINKNINNTNIIINNNNEIDIKSEECNNEDDNDEVKKEKCELHINIDEKEKISNYFNSDINNEQRNILGNNLNYNKKVNNSSDAKLNDLNYNLNNDCLKNSLISSNNSLNDNLSYVNHNNNNDECIMNNNFINTNFSFSMNNVSNTKNNLDNMRNINILNNSINSNLSDINNTKNINNIDKNIDNNVNNYNLTNINEENINVNVNVNVNGNMNNNNINNVDNHLDNINYLNKKNDILYNERNLNYDPIYNKNIYESKYLNIKNNNNLNLFDQNKSGVVTKSNIILTNCNMHSKENIIYPINATHKYNAVNHKENFITTDNFNNNFNVDNENNVKNVNTINILNSANNLNNISNVSNLSSINNVNNMNNLNRVNNLNILNSMNSLKNINNFNNVNNMGNIGNMNNLNNFVNKNKIFEDEILKSINLANNPVKNMNMIDNNNSYKNNVSMNLMKNNNIINSITYNQNKLLINKQNIPLNKYVNNNNNVKNINNNMIDYRSINNIVNPNTNTFDYAQINENKNYLTFSHINLSHRKNILCDNKTNDKVNLFLSYNKMSNLPNGYNMEGTDKKPINLDNYSMNNVIKNDYNSNIVINKSIIDINDNKNMKIDKHINNSTNDMDERRHLDNTDMNLLNIKSCFHNNVLESKNNLVINQNDNNKNNINPKVTNNKLNSYINDNIGNIILNKNININNFINNGRQIVQNNVNSYLSNISSVNIHNINLKKNENIYNHKNISIENKVNNNNNNNNTVNTVCKQNSNDIEKINDHLILCNNENINIMNKMKNPKGTYICNHTKNCISLNNIANQKINDINTNKILDERIFFNNSKNRNACLNSKSDFSKNVLDKNYDINKNSKNNENINYLSNFRNIINHSNSNNNNNTVQNNFKDNFYSNLNILTNNKNITNMNFNDNIIYKNNNVKINSCNNKINITQTLKSNRGTRLFKNSVMNEHRNILEQHNEEIEVDEHNDEIDEGEINENENIQERKYLHNGVPVKREKKNQESMSSSYYLNNNIIQKHYEYNNLINNNKINDIIHMKNSLNYSGITNHDKKANQEDSIQTVHNDLLTNDVKNKNYDELLHNKNIISNNQIYNIHSKIANNIPNTNFISKYNEDLLTNNERHNIKLVDENNNLNNINDIVNCNSLSNDNICYRNIESYNGINENNISSDKSSKNKNIMNVKLDNTTKNRNSQNSIANIGTINDINKVVFNNNKINENQQHIYDIEQGNAKYISNSSDITVKKKENENVFRMSKTQLLSLENDIKYLQSLSTYIKSEDLYFETYEETDVYYDKSNEYAHSVNNCTQISTADYIINKAVINNKDYLNRKLKKEKKKTKYYTNKFSSKMKYTIIEEGSFGVVYKGWYKGLNVAVKIPVDKMARQDPYGLTKRSINEWKILSKCDHPNIIKLCGGIIHSYFDIWLVTKLVNGLDLHTIKNNMSKDEKVLSIDISLKMCRQLAEVIDFLHTPIKNKKDVIIHRDIKPENLIIDNDWNIHLCDFGDAEECEDGIVTNVSGATWIYAPPELLTCHPLKQSSDYNFLDHTKLSYKWDIWSMGCVFQEMMNLPSPFQHYIITFEESDQIYEKLVDVFTKKLPPCIHSKIENSPFADIIRLCLNYDPNLRPTASEIVKLLNQPDEYLLLKRK